MNEDYADLADARYDAERELCRRVVKRVLAIAAKVTGKDGDTWRHYGTICGVNQRLHVRVRVDGDGVVVSLSDIVTADGDAENYGQYASPASIASFLAPDIRKLAALPWPRELSA